MNKRKRFLFFYFTFYLFLVWGCSFWCIFFCPFLSAYEILSDEQKRKNYDLYGDEKGNPGFGAGHPGGQGGPGSFTFRPGEQWGSGDQGSSKSFSFSFGGSGDSNSFGFGLDDILGNFFGGGFGPFGSSFSSQSGSKSTPKSFRSLTSNIYKKEIIDEGMTWLLLSYAPSLRGIQHFESIIGEVSGTLQGALKVFIYFWILFNFINCFVVGMTYCLLFDRLET